jgi:hypothetical protein
LHLARTRRISNTLPKREFARTKEVKPSGPSSGAPRRTELVPTSLALASHRSNFLLMGARQVVAWIDWLRGARDMPTDDSLTTYFIVELFGPEISGVAGSARPQIQGTSGRWSVGSFPPEARASHRTACRNPSNLRTSIAPLLDCSDQAPPVPDLPPGRWRASPLSWLNLPT